MIRHVDLRGGGGGFWGFAMYFFVWIRVSGLQAEYMYL